MLSVMTHYLLCQNAEKVNVVIQLLLKQRKSIYIGTLGNDGVVCRDLAISLLKVRKR